MTRTNKQSQGQYRDKTRNYIGMNGREVYYRNKASHGASREKTGWTCSYCAQFELSCICPKSERLLREGKS